MSARLRSFVAMLFFAALAALCLAPAPFGGSVVVTWGTAAPTISTITSIGTGGGTAQLAGANFVGSASNPPQAWVFLSGYPGPATALLVLYNSSASLNLTLANGTYTAGIYPVQIQDADGQTIVDLGNLQITPNFTPPVIGGANLKAQYIAAHATCSGTCTTGSAVVTVPDDSANGNVLNLVSATAPTVVLNDPDFQMSNVTSIAMVGGSSTTLGIASLNLGASPAAVNIVGCGIYVTATGTGGLWSWQGSVSGATTNTSSFSFDPAGTATGITPLNMGAIVEQSIDGTTNRWSVNNAVTGSPASSNAPANSKAFVIGERVTSTQYASFHWTEIDIFNIKLSSTQLAEEAAYCNDTYGVTNPPGFAQVTPMAASTASTPLRITNATGMSNFYTTTAVSVVQGSSSYACTNQGVGTTAAGRQYIDAECASTPAATSDLFLKNPDGRGKTLNNAVNVTTASNMWTQYGFSLIGWWIPGVYYTCSTSPCLSGSSTLTSYLDQSGMDQVPTQSTGADEPVFQSGVGDATFNNNPYSAPNGTTDQLVQSGSAVNDVVVTNGTAEVFVAIVHEPASGVSTGAVVRFNTGNDFRAEINSAIPVASYAGTTSATFGSATTSTTQNIEWDLPGGASPTLYVNAANSGSAVTASTSAPANTFANQTIFFHSTNGANRSNAPLYELGFVNSVPTSGQRTTQETRANSCCNAI